MILTVDDLDNLLTLMDIHDPEDYDVIQENYGFDVEVLRDNGFDVEVLRDKICDMLTSANNS